MGTPTPLQWPDLEWLPDFVEYSSQIIQPWRKLCPTASDDALDLLSKMFTYDPRARISVQQALEHRSPKSFKLEIYIIISFPALNLCFAFRYFTSIPLPTDPAKLPRPAPKRESHNPRTSDLHDRPVVLSPKRKARRVMSDREGFAGNSFQVDKVDEHGGEIRQAAGDNTGRNEPVLMSVDFSVFGSKPMSRPTINR